MTPEILTAIAEGIGAVGLVIFGVAQWSNGRNSASVETVQTYKDLLEARERKYQASQDSMQTQINDLSAKIGEYKGLITGKDQQIADYKQIFENRNPKLEEILTKMSNFMEQVDGRLTDIAEHIKKPVVAKSETTTTVSKGNI